MRSKSFLITMEDSVRFNQVKGKNMDGLFSEDKLYKVKVFTDGESIYYAKDEKKLFLGVNRIKCKDMVIDLDSNRVSSVHFLANPEGEFLPLKDVTPKEMQLKGFSWLFNTRPKSKEDLLKESDNKQ